VTRTSILNPNRNPNLTEEQATEILKKYLGLKNVIWLSGMDGEDPELGDETDCHVDLLCRFVSENTVLYGWPDEENQDDPLFRRLLKPARDELREAVTASGKPLDLVPVPVPMSPMYSTTRIGAVQDIIKAGRARLGTGRAAIGNCCGYLDWHVANSVVLLPIFGDENDDRAISIITEHFPGREIVSIDCRLLLEGGGGIHCVTKEQPAVSIPPDGMPNE
jgi:agmatine deiminase